MARIVKGWLEFGGVKSTEFGARLTDFISLTRPELRGTSYEVTGRSGDLWKTHGDYKPFDLKRKIRFRLSRLDDVSAWLTGSGMLRFSWAENRAYEARAVKSANIEQISIDEDPVVELPVTFTCQPFRLLHPEAEAFTITASGTSFTNPGTAPSKPRVKITGSGDFSVTIGMETLFFSDISDGGIIVDSVLMDALTYDGTLLANDKMDGMPWTIQPGVNYVSWLVEDGSSIDSIEILPRWRYI